LTNVTDDDLVMTAKIALAHLNELPDYYDRLAEMENPSHAGIWLLVLAGAAYWMFRR
jgi:multisubunit Na+/H+ antiporter MnhG subunit